MKLAMVLAGRLKSAAVRPPTRQPDDETRAQIGAVLARVGMLQKQAA
jgi:dihydrodipicolinate synthase/N-acetylneuraminate lyase